MAAAQMFQWCVAAVDGGGGVCVCMCLCICMHTTGRVLCIHAFMHAYEHLCVCVCVLCECVIGEWAGLLGGVWPFFKHSCVVMVA